MSAVGSHYQPTASEDREDFMIINQERMWKNARQYELYPLALHLILWACYYELRISSVDWYGENIKLIELKNSGSLDDESDALVVCLLSW
jgi:hypothetical protein